MYSTELPKRLRFDFRLREPKLGIDVPAKFFYDMKALDPDLYLIYHPIRVLPTTPVINQYSGSLEDYRTPTHVAHGQVCWGYPLTDSKGAPIPEHKWHIYRLCPQGWAHVITLDYKGHVYLQKVIDNIYQQVLCERMGPLAYRKWLEEKANLAQQKKFNKGLDTYNSIQEENKWLIRKAKEEAERGNYKPTMPTKDIISSYRGQTNRSRIVRPLTDTEGGLILPDHLKQ